MADYIYLLGNRLSAAQQAALQTIRQVARKQSLTVFLVGGAVRDLTSGSPVRDLDVAVQGNVLKLRKEFELAGAVLLGEVVAAQALFLRFPGGVRVEVGSTVSVAYPKPGKPVVHTATIQEDLRRRDFTANAMALSLNDGSYGLLMDPLNGVADIENRQLRLVSNYGFIEDPVRMIRATRFSARLGWTLEEKTQTRYETGKAEKYIGALSAAARGYETEEIFHEEDPLRVMRRLEEEGWLKTLSPALGVARANAAELEKLREVQTQLQMAGIHPDASAAHLPLLTAKLSAAEVADLKKSFVRPGFVAEVEALEAEAKEFAAQLGAKSMVLPSQMWKLIHAAKPEAVLWAGYSSKNATLQAKLKSFETEWPKARTRIPYPLMQEMRIVPALENFDAVVDLLFFELMDGKLGTVEELKAFLEPYSPPAPPPPVKLSRSRAGKKDAKGKGKKKGAAEETSFDVQDDELDDEAPAVAAVEVDDPEIDEVAELVGASFEEESPLDDLDESEAPEAEETPLPEVAPQEEPADEPADPAPAAPKKKKAAAQKKEPVAAPNESPTKTSPAIPAKNVKVTTVRAPAKAVSAKAVVVVAQPPAKEKTAAKAPPTKAAPPAKASNKKR